MRKKMRSNLLFDCKCKTPSKILFTAWRVGDYKECRRFVYVWKRLSQLELDLSSCEKVSIPLRKVYPKVYEGS